MKIKWFGAGILVALVCVFFTLMLVRPPAMPSFPDGKGPVPEKDMGFFMEGGEPLRITPEQKEQMDLQRSIHMQEGKELFERMRSAHAALVEEFQKPELDMERIRALNEEIKETLARIEDHKLEGILSLREILTPEQFILLQRKTGELMKREMKQPPFPG